MKRKLTVNSYIYFPICLKTCLEFGDMIIDKCSDLTVVLEEY